MTESIYTASFELDAQGDPYIDIDTGDVELDHPTMPGWAATTRIPYEASEDYEPEVYRAALMEEGWEVVAEAENGPWTVRQANA